MLSSDKAPSIFISHSSKDIAIARAARNLFEDRKHFVGFFGWLQQMTDKEIETFLEAEVKMHTWLLLIETENANNSRWVRFEIERAKHYGKALYAIEAQRFTEDTDKTRQEIETDEKFRSCIHKLSKGFRIFLSYTRVDTPFASRLRDELRVGGFDLTPV